VGEPLSAGKHSVREGLGDGLRVQEEARQRAGTRSVHRVVHTRGGVRRQKRGRSPERIEPEAVEAIRLEERMDPVP
jgi:hypothetical protein